MSNDNPNNYVQVHAACGQRHDTRMPCPKMERVPKSVLAANNVNKIVNDLFDEIRQLAVLKLRLQQVRVDRTARPEQTADAALAYRAMEKSVSAKLDGLIEAHIAVMLAQAEERDDDDRS